MTDKFKLREVNLETVSDEDWTVTEIQSGVGILVAHQFGKTAARYVLFSARGYRLTARLMEAGSEKYSTMFWQIVTSEGKVVGLFSKYEVIGVWDAETAVIQP